MVLARLPVSYAVWKRLSLFEHGAMDRPEAAIDTFTGHARTAGVLVDGTLRAPMQVALPGSGFTFVELGPGDSVAAAMVGRALGATRSWLVDAGAFATTSAQAYERLADALRARGLAVDTQDRPLERATVLDACNSRYLVQGVDSLAEIPASSVDYMFSNAVLEHIPAEDFDRMIAEWVRVLRPGGVALHRVDLRDHLGGGLDNLRFSDALWNSPLFRRSGFYTNRIRFRDMIDRFQSAGFMVEVPKCARWKAVPIARGRLASRFSAVDDEDLSVSGFDVRLVKPTLP